MKAPLTILRPSWLWSCLSLFVCSLAYCHTDKAVQQTVSPNTTHNYTLYAKALTQYQSGHYEDALLLWQQCVPFYKEKDNQHYLQSLHYLALTYFKKADYQQSGFTALLGADESQRLNNKMMSGYFSQVMGLNAFIAGKYTDAILKLNSFYPAKGKADWENESLTDLYLGKSYWMLQQQAKAIPYFKSIAKRYEQQGYLHPDVREAYEQLITYYADNQKKQLVYITLLQEADRSMAQQYPFLFPKTVKQYDEADLKELQQEAAGSFDFKWVALLVVVPVVWGDARYYYQKRPTDTPAEEDRWSDEEALAGTAWAAELSTEVTNSIMTKLEEWGTDKKYLDSADVKQLFNIGDKTLYRWRTKGEIPFAKIGGKLVYPKKAILAILQARLDNKYDPIHIKKHQKGE